ncbi:MAG: NADH-quinone oxidoreductase subunit A [Gemmatimonadetes bacterium]|nr:NADH-quinone oxidoreductase subunit A [Gemmatimonadota bacterium]
MIQEYIPILLLTGFVIANGIGMLVVSHLVSPRRPTKLKGAPYESGMPPLGGARLRFSVKFYLIAMLFIVFDIEVVFLIPWGVAFRKLGLTGLLAMAIFIVMLEVGHAYAWKRGALEWD